MAKCGVTNIGGGGGIGSDELSVTKEYVLSGKTYVGADTDDKIGTGTMENNGATTNQSLNAGGAFTVKKGYHSQAFNVTANSLASQTSGTATAGQILSGQTAWVNGNKLTGTMAVQSILSFSAAVYSSTAIAFTWKNPVKGPFSGVIIVGKAGAYPTSITDGTRYYKGAGSNTVASGTSTATVSSFTSGTMYSTQNNTEWVHATSYTATAATTKGQQVITTSGTFTVPVGVRSIDVFLVGGGAAGGSATGYGGGGGWTQTWKGVAVTPGQQLSVSIGAGGINFGKGGDTIFGSLKAAGGNSWNWGGGSPGKDYAGSNDSRGNGGDGGSDGATGESWVTSDPNNGQGHSTRSFGETSGTLYAGGGGGSSGFRHDRWSVGGAGGAGGGGRGNTGSPYSSQGDHTSGSPNTGGGGGGAGWYEYNDDGDTRTQPSSSGGSGICIVRWGY